jgi:hypothetical protein
MRIGDIVEHNPHAFFANDVQLDWYPGHEKNLGLVRGYIFTDEAPAGTVSSVGLLQQLQMSLTSEPENRHVAVAGYGRGKSHFALALANLFGKPAESEEVGCLLDAIERVAKPPVAQSLKEFKESRKPFLVVRLRGDLSPSLSQQFLHGLEQAVSETFPDAQEQLPFWFEAAARFLEGLDGPHLELANAFLSQHDLDVAVLARHVRDLDGQVYDLCRRVVFHVHGVYPDFREVTLKDAIGWAVRSYCREPNVRAGGILVLFDEFSAFIHRYAARGEVGGTASLQDMLSGISEWPRDVVFLAFSQHSPQVVARSVFHRGDERQESLLKELERLPPSAQYELHSSVENVLDSYLAQKQGAMDLLLDQYERAFEDATNTAMTMLAPRYDDASGWGTERFDKVVTHGCFPLHPLTTGLFCGVRLQEVTGTRDVLGHVRAALTARFDEPAVKDGRPNWIYPIALVDWYGRMLGEQAFLDYDYTCGRVGPEAPLEQQNILKALLLFRIGGLKLGGMRFTAATQHLTGHREDVCKKALESLYEGGYIRHDLQRGTYDFWPAGGGGDKLEQFLQEEMRGKSVDAAFVRSIETTWRTQKRLATVPVEGVVWGHSEDWAAEEVLLTRDEFTPERLRSLARPFRIGSNGMLQEGRRATVVRLLAPTPEDVAFLDERAEATLDEAIGADRTALVLAVPLESHAALAEAALREHLLLNWRSEQVEEVGAAIYADAKLRTSRQIDEGLKRMRDWCRHVVPGSFRARIAALGASEHLERLLRECVALSYPYHPPVFFTQYRADQRNLKGAVRLLAPMLAANRVRTEQEKLAANKVANDLRSKFLSVGPKDSWGVLGVTGETRQPTSEKTLKAWSHLDSVFKPGTENVPLGDGLLPLLNPPFGYDWNTLLVLFAAWVGNHRRDVEFSAAGELLALEMEQVLGASDPREVVQSLCGIRQILVSRRDPREVEEEIRALAERARTGEFEQEDAANTVERLRVYDADHENPEATRADARRGFKALEIDLQKAHDYDSVARRILERLEPDAPRGGYYTALEEIKELPRLGRVRSTSEDTPSSLRESTVARITEVVEADCARLTKLSDITDYGQHRNELATLRRQMADVGLADLASRVDRALADLDKARGELDAERADAEVRAVLANMRTPAPLATLRADWKHLKSLKAHSETMRKQIAQRSQELDEAIQQEEEYAAGLAEKVDALTDIGDVRRLQREILESKAGYTGAPELNQVEAAISRCDTVEGYLRSLDELRRYSIRTRQDVEETRANLTSLGERTSELSEIQRALIPAALAALDARIAEEETKARAWLADLEARAPTAKDPGTLLHEASRVPEFFPAAAQERLEAIRAALDERVKQLQNAQEAERQRREQEAELKRRDEPIEAEIDAIAANASLSMLRKSLQRLSELEPCTERVAAKLAEKRQLVTEAEKRHCLWIEGLPQKLDGIATVEALESVRDEINRKHQAYVEVPEFTEVESALQRCEALREYLQTITSARTRSLKSPADVESLEAALCSAATKAKGNLSPAQEALCIRAQKELQEQAETQRKEALAWLQRAEAKKADGDPTQLLGELEKSPTFLPADEQHRLLALRSHLQQRINDDAVLQVIERFRNINGRNQREVCIRRLQEILAEEGQV